MEELLELLQKYCVYNYKITSKHYGNSLKFGKLKQLIVYDRFILDASEFEALGYGLIMRVTK